MKRLLGIALAVVVAFAAQPSFAFQNRPDVEAEAIGPRTATVLWDVPAEAGEGGTKTVQAWELELADNFAFNDATTFTYDPSTLAVTLTRDNGLISISRYYVRVRANYSDSSNSQYSSKSFYTQIGKVGNLRVSQASGVVTLKWDKTVRARDLMTYNVKVYAKKKLVFDDSVVGKNTISITGLTVGKQYRYKVRARQDSTYGIGKWSDYKKFTAK